MCWSDAYLLTPDLSDPFIRKLYGMYVTYLDEGDFAYDLTQRCDSRGCLAEFIKSEHFRQIFVSRTKPGIARVNHFHHTKAEKFLVLEGKVLISVEEYEQLQANGHADAASPVSPLPPDLQRLQAMLLEQARELEQRLDDPIAGLAALFSRLPPAHDNFWVEIQKTCYWRCAILPIPHYSLWR